MFVLNTLVDGADFDFFRGRGKISNFRLTKLTYSHKVATFK